MEKIKFLTMAALATAFFASCSNEDGVKQFNPKVLFSPALLAAFVAALLVAFVI